MRRRRKRLGKDSNKADYRAPRPASSTQRRPPDSDYSPPEQHRSRAEEVRSSLSQGCRLLPKDALAHPVLMDVLFANLPCCCSVSPLLQLSGAGRWRQRRACRAGQARRQGRPGAHGALGRRAHGRRASRVRCGAHSCGLRRRWMAQLSAGLSTVARGLLPRACSVPLTFRFVSHA